MSPYFEAAITVACAIGSWVVAGWVTVNIIKTKMEDMIRRIGVTEGRLDALSTAFNAFQLQYIRDIEKLRRECPLLGKSRKEE